MSQTQTQVREEKFFYYYPAYNKRFARRILTGLVSGNKIYVAQAVCFPGIKPTLLPVPLTDGKVVLLVDPGMRPDSFNKKEGKRIAEERAQGWKMLPNGTKVHPGRDLIMTIDITEADQAHPGQLFVREVEKFLAAKGFPPRERKVKVKPDSSANSNL